MYFPTIIVAFLGSSLLVKATGENSCTSTAIVSVTAEVPPLGFPAESTGFVTHSGPIATQPISVAESTGFVTHSGPIQSFTSITTAHSLATLNPSAMSSLASAIESSSYPYNLSFGPGGGINPNPTSRTNIVGSTSKTASFTLSTSSKTSTTTSSAAAATTTTAAAVSTTTTPQPASGAAVATAMPAAKGANLALAMVAGGMFLL